MLVVLQVLVVLHANVAVEGIFFLDLLCATRIDNLERQVASLADQLRVNGLIPSQQGQQGPTIPAG